MTIFTMGYTKKDAKTFFTAIKNNSIELLIDIRLYNSISAGFTKGEDLKYFLPEICKCEYAHDLVFAPTKEIFKNYKSKKISWDEYEIKYRNLIVDRNAVEHFKSNYFNYNNICLLCCEPAPEKCHRRLLAEMLQENCIRHL